MWFKTGSNITGISIGGIEYPVQHGYLELPDGLKRGLLKYITDSGYKQIPECEAPDIFKGPKLPPVFEDAQYPLPAQAKEK